MPELQPRRTASNATLSVADAASSWSQRRNTQVVDMSAFFIESQKLQSLNVQIRLDFHGFLFFATFCFLWGLTIPIESRETRFQRRDSREEQLMEPGPADPTGCSSCSR